MGSLDTQSGEYASKMTSKPPVVLFVSHEASRTGAPILLLRFLRWFGQNQATPFRMLVGSAGALLPEFKALGPVDLFQPEVVTVWHRLQRRLKLGKSRKVKHLERLRAALQKEPIDLIYSNTVVNGAILDFLSFLNVPVISHIHELDHVIREGFGERNLELVKKHTSSYIAVSQAVKDNLVKNYGIAGQAVKVIYGFIPTNLPSPDDAVKLRETARKELGISPQTTLVLSCGSIEPRKGTDLFLAAASQVANRAPAADVHFLWVGGSPAHMKEMQKKIAASGLSGKVHFIGHRPDVTPYYIASDIFLLTSREDPFPLVMLESALHGKPTVCFAEGGGAREFVRDDAGCCVPGFAVDQMANAVLELAQSPDRRLRMGNVARERVLREHDIHVAAPKIAAVIQEALLAKSATSLVS